MTKNTAYELLQVSHTIAYYVMVNDFHDLGLVFSFPNGRDRNTFKLLGSEDN